MAVLIDKAAKIDDQDHFGLTPLHIAVANSNPAIVFITS